MKQICSSLFFFLLCLGFGTLAAQEARVIDNKGTLHTVTSNTVTTTAVSPTTPVDGDVWFDTTSNTTKIYEAATATWKTIDPDSVTVSATTPTLPIEGDVWFDTASNTTKIYTGSNWHSIQASSALSLWDNDRDTGIQVEETGGEDKIRFDTANAERMIIDASGNVGIGTTLPTQRLDVNGIGLFRNGQNNNVFTGDQIQFSHGGGSLYKQAIRTRHNGGGDAGNAIDFYTWDHGTNANGDSPTLHNMTITQGRVGVGTTSPGETLTVNGTAQITGLPVATGTVSVVVANANGVLQTVTVASIAGTDSQTLTVTATLATATGSASETIEVALEGSSNASYTIDLSSLEEVVSGTTTPSAHSFTKNPTQGDLFVDTTSSTLWAYDGNSWSPVRGDDSNNWNIVGNSGTDSSTHFIGTTDAQALVVKTNDAPRLIVPSETSSSTRLLLANTGNFGLLLSASPFQVTTSALLGIEGANHSRLRLTAGSQDTFNDTQGASIDLHGNDATMNAGMLDLVSGSTASGTTAAIRFWTNPTGAMGGQGTTPRMVFTGEGHLGIGTTTVTETLTVSGTAQITDLPTATGTTSVVVANANGVLQRVALASISGTDSQTLTVTATLATATGSASETIEVALEGSSNASYTIDLSSLEEVVSGTTTPSAHSFTKNPTQGDLFVDTTTSTLWTYDGNSWSPVRGDDSNNWNIVGNSGTDSSTHFIGTTDAQALVVKTNDAPRLIVPSETTSSTRLLLANPGDFQGAYVSSSAVLGIDGTTNHSRLRLTAGSQDTFSDSEGASIDLHGNDATANAGVLDLVAGSTASGTTAAIRFYTNNGSQQQTSAVITGAGNMGIGNTAPNANAILDLTNTDGKAFLLPTETMPTNISSPTDGMLVYSTNNDNAYLRADSAWKPIAYNAVTNELIFDGADDADTSNDNFYYVSMVINGAWKVIRYNKTDVNDEKEAMQTTTGPNSGQTTQPTDLATCTGLSFS